MGKTRYLDRREPKQNDDQPCEADDIQTEPGKGSTYAQLQQETEHRNPKPNHQK